MHFDSPLTLLPAPLLYHFMSRIKISKVELLSIDLHLDQHEKRFLVTLPADLELEVNL